MIWLLVSALTLLLVASTWFIVIILKKNLALSDQREVLVDQIEESLDVLDACYVRLAHNMEIPVLSDEPVIREIIADVKRAKAAVLMIASKVVTYGEEKGSPRGEE